MGRLQDFNYMIWFFTGLNGGYLIMTDTTKNKFLENCERWPKEFPFTEKDFIKAEDYVPKPWEDRTSWLKKWMV